MDPEQTTGVYVQMGFGDIIVMVSTIQYNSKNKVPNKSPLNTRATFIKTSKKPITSNVGQHAHFMSMTLKNVMMFKTSCLWNIGIFKGHIKN